MAREIKPIGQLIRDARRAKKMTVRTVARLVGMSERYLSNIETGYRPNPPRYDTLLKLGLFLGIHEKDLMWSAAQYYVDLEAKKTQKQKEPENEQQ